MSERDQQPEPYSAMKFGANLDLLRELFDKALDAKRSMDVQRARRYLIRMLELLS